MCNFAPSMKHKSIILGVDYIGRLGNQLFTYAYVRQLMEKKSLDNYSIIANFTRTAGGEICEGFTDSLCHFNVKPYSKEDVHLVMHYGSLLQRMAFLVYEVFLRIGLLRRFEAFSEWVYKWLDGYDIYLSSPADKARTLNDIKPCSSVFVRGFFQDSKNFDDIRPVLLEEFTPRYPALNQNRELYDVAARDGSVCVSIRCGDFMSSQYKKDYYVCTPRYFQEAISIMKSRVKQPIFIFFSDDIEWVKNNIAVENVPCYYESGQDPVWEKLRLMYSCHHFIISNSTFSWWAQYLGRREDKIVVSPSQWYANPEWHSCLIEKSFVLVN